MYMLKLSVGFSPLQYLTEGFEMLVNTVTPFFDLLFPKFILDELTGEKRWERVVAYILLWTAVNSILLLSKTLEWVAVSKYNEKNYHKEQLHFAEAKADMDYGRLESGEVLNEERRIRDNLSIAFFAEYPAASIVSSLIQLAGYTYIVFTLHPLMIFPLIIIFFLNARAASAAEKIKFECQGQTARFKRKFDYIFNAMISYPYAKEVRINGAARWLAQKYDAQAGEYIGFYSEQQKKERRYGCETDAVTFAETVLLYMYSSYRVLTGGITLGSFGMYIGAVGAFVNSISSVIEKLADMKYMSEYIDAYRKYMANAAPSHRVKGTRDVDFGQGRHEIEFRNVSFRYPNSESYVLKNISLKIKSGEHLSLVGYNGSGKSTFVKLLCRLYEPTEGVILYNGKDISSLMLEEYMRLLAVVFQDYNIFSLSLRENICLACNTDDEAVLKAIEMSGLSEKVRKLPLGESTQLGREFDENGIEFSGGEGQKVACARAYYKDAPIVILDEPTASLDPFSESRLYERFNGIIGNKTAVYISHRLAGVRFCDRIAVFADGGIAELGAHDELIERNGIYAEMFKKQAEYYTDAYKERK